MKQFSLTQFMLAIAATAFVSVGGLHVVTVMTIGENQARHEERLTVVEDAFSRFLDKWESDHDLLVQLAEAIRRMDAEARRRNVGN